MAMMAITTNNSISVKAGRLIRELICRYPFGNVRGVN